MAEAKLTNEEIKTLLGRIFFVPGEWEGLSQEEKARIEKLDFHEELQRVCGEFDVERRKKRKNNMKVER